MYFRHYTVILYIYIVNDKSPQGYEAYTSFCVYTLNACGCMLKYPNSLEQLKWHVEQQLPLAFTLLGRAGSRPLFFSCDRRNFRWCQASLLPWPGLKLFAAMLCHNQLVWDQLRKVPNNRHLHTIQIAVIPLCILLCLEYHTTPTPVICMLI